MYWEIMKGCIGSFKRILKVSEYYDKASPRSTQAGLFLHKVFVFGHGSQRPKWPMRNIGTRLKTNNLNFGDIHKHNQKKIMPPKPQIISYCPSMIDINNSIFIDYHKMLSCWTQVSYVPFATLQIWRLFNFSPWKKGGMN